MERAGWCMGLGVWGVRRWIWRIRLWGRLIFGGREVVGSGMFLLLVFDLVILTVV